MNENEWKWMKMDENGWKWMKMNENEWKWMKKVKMDEKRRISVTQFNSLFSDLNFKFVNFPSAAHFNLFPGSL